jgi:hypothetical protein
MKDFGTGPKLREACRWLRNDHERHARILDVAERDSVIEGLPPFQEETRRRILAGFRAQAAPGQPEAPGQ